MMNEKKPDIVALSETHLKRQEEPINIYGYKWEGENNVQAMRGSRGVGF